VNESQLWEINARLARVLPLVRDEAALSRLVQHVHPDTPEDQVYLLVDDLRALLVRDLSDLAAALLAVSTRADTEPVEADSLDRLLGIDPSDPLSKLARQLVEARRELRELRAAFYGRHTCLACGSTCGVHDPVVTRRLAGTLHPRTGRITFDEPLLQVIKPDDMNESNDGT
jgi:hypothetical protein